MTNKGAGRGFNIDYLDQYCAHCVIGGPGCFLMPVTDRQQFPETIRRKLTLEIGGTVSPEPNVVPVAAPALRRQGVSAAAPDCLIGEKIWEQQ